MCRLFSLPRFIGTMGLAVISRVAPVCIPIPRCSSSTSRSSSLQVLRKPGNSRARFIIVRASHTGRNGFRPETTNGRAGSRWKQQEQDNRGSSDRRRVMDFLQMLLNVVVPPAGVVLLLLTWPLLAFVNFWRWVLGYVFAENMRGKVVLITGASSGIGEHMSYEYGRRGAKLMLVGRREELLNDVAEHARSSGAMDVKTVVADVSREEDCKKLVDETINAFGCIDHLVCNAGIANSFLFEEARGVDAFHKIMDTNFLGAVYSTYFALEHLRKSRGKIVVTASTASWLPMPRMSIYNASKAAMVNFFDTLRVEIGSDLGGITIAMPGYVKSEMTKGKFMTSDGSFDMDADIRDIQVGPSPVACTEDCAKSIVSAAVRGRRYMVVPAWYKISLLYRVFAPELLESNFRFMFVKEMQQGKPMTKVVMDAIPSAEKVLYPPGMQQKTEEKTQ